MSTEFICIFVVVNIEYKILQAMYKVTNIFSEIASFFQRSSKISAIGAISGVMKNDLQFFSLKKEVFQPID